MNRAARALFASLATTVVLYMVCTERPRGALARSLHPCALHTVRQGLPPNPLRPDHERDVHAERANDDESCALAYFTPSQTSTLCGHAMFGLFGAAVA